MTLPAQIFRIDRFEVPAVARSSFLEKVAMTHAALRRQPGLVFERIVETEAGQGKSRIVTIAAWANAEAIAAAREAIAAVHRAEGFDARAFLAHHGIDAEMGTYHALPPTVATSQPDGMVR